MKTKLTLVFAVVTWTFVSAQSTKPMMKAVVVHEYGGPEMLKYEDAPRPEPKENEMLVRMIAAGVNPSCHRSVSWPTTRRRGRCN